MKTLYLLIFFLPGGDSAESPHELEDDADPGENQTVHVVRPTTIMTLLAYSPTGRSTLTLSSCYQCYPKTHFQYPFVCFFLNHSSFVIFSMSKSISIYFSLPKYISYSLTAYLKAGTQWYRSKGPRWALNFRCKSMCKNFVPDVLGEWGESPAHVEEGESHRDDVDLLNRPRAHARYVCLKK